MKILSLLALSTIVATPAFSQQTRELDSHEHGVGQLDIAIEGSQVAMELHAPGADIVGFEYKAESTEDIAKVEAALSVLAQPLDLFGLPEAAQCSVVEAHAKLESEDDHEDDDHADHDEEGHDDHNDEHDEDDHDDHAGEGHDDHDEDHADEENAAGHTEFHAEYLLECGDITALTEISFAYFTAFPNALEVEVQVISDAGATAFEVERGSPMLDLSDLN